MAIVPKNPAGGGGGGSSITDYTQVPNLTTALAAKADASALAAKADASALAAKADASALATKADASAVAALQTTVAAKADASALTGLAPKPSAAAASGKFHKWNGTAWVEDNLPAPATMTIQTFNAASGATTLNAAVNNEYRVATNTSGNAFDTTVNLPATANPGDRIRVMRTTVGTFNNATYSKAVTVVGTGVPAGTIIRHGTAVDFKWNGTGWDASIDPATTVIQPIMTGGFQNSTARIPMDLNPAATAVSSKVVLRGRKMVKFFSQTSQVTQTPAFNATNHNIAEIVTRTGAASVFGVTPTGATETPSQSVTARFSAKNNYSQMLVNLTPTVLATPLDLSANLLGLSARIDWSSPATTCYMRIEVSSDGFGASNTWSYQEFPGSKSPQSILSNFGGAEWRTATKNAAQENNPTEGGAGANLASINAIRIRLRADTNQQIECELVSLFTVPKANPAKAKVLLTFDDSKPNHMSTTLPLLASYGFVGTLFCFGNESTSLTPDQHQIFDDLGWQIASHQNTSENHNTITSGSTLRMEFAQADWAMRVNGFHQTRDWAHYGNVQPTEDTMKALRQRYRSARANETMYPNGKTADTYFKNNRVAELPPLNPHYIMSYLVGSNDYATQTPTTDNGLGMRTYVDRAVTAKGAAIFCFHNIDGNVTHAPSGVKTTDGTIALLDYLKTLVDAGTIEVITMAELLDPFTVAC